MLVLEDIAKSYPGPGGPVEVLNGLSLHVQPGELAVIQGPSGCGKSTLLFIAGAMLPPDKGRVCFAEQQPYTFSRARRNRFRADVVGFIFQRFHLIPYLSVEDNLRWPLRWSDDPARHGRRIPELGDRLGIRHRFAHRPAQLSAGEQQRVAVARALLGNKQLICADEPTGNLDDENAALIRETLREEAGRGRIVLLVTHHQEWAARSDVLLRLNTPTHAGQDAAARRASTPPPC